MYPYPMPAAYASTTKPAIVSPADPVPSTVPVQSSSGTEQYGLDWQDLKDVVAEVLGYYKILPKVLEQVKACSDLPALICILEKLSDRLQSKPERPINPSTGRPISRQAMHLRRKQSGIDKVYQTVSH
jgi:hypothetical protein